MHIKTQETFRSNWQIFKTYINQELARVWENKKRALLGSV